MNAEYKKYLKSAKWAMIRIDLFMLRGKKCEKCSSKHKIQVHHKTYKNIFKEEPEDLIILCDYCHKSEHGIIKRKKGKHNLTLAQKVSRKKRLNKNKKLKKLWKQ